jgi:cell division protein FtsQ
VAATRKAAARTRAAVLPFPQPRKLALGRFLPSGRALAVGFALVAVAAGGYAAARFTSMFAVEAVVVRGAPPGLAADVHEALAPAENRSLLELDLGALEARVLDIPDVASVRWDRAFPHRLVATVERERPAAVLRRGTDAWLLSESGRVLRPLPRGARGALPRIWVPRPVDVAVGARLAERPVVGALQALRPLPHDFPVRVRSVTSGDSLVFELETGLELRLGTELDVALKLAVAASVVPSLPAPAEGGPEYLDVSVPERPVTGTNPQVED